ncbi:sugar transferase [Pseudidiomarina sp. GXY010]|uniref:Sugar transferase n=1 Tax=Pseudidiomarina fusca TaxID=2965078 RepID=A0ABU3KY73_9GAMM|nr:sugar transferase [Pseudidiomarina sp. GXY010]MDT7526324.1 sugar transferase [Pseudidiomarina sp. GXY010]
MLIKRLFDIIASAVALLLLLPLLLLVGLFVRLKLGSPVFFQQVRPGLNEKTFNMLKFRTMTDERDAEGKLLPDSIRLTPFGSFLRKTSLDELPELINILKGDMSFVGPRPLLIEYLDYYTDDEKLRHTVRPGLTGLAQVSGRNHVLWDDRLALDVKYVKEWTFWLDIQILFKTVLQVTRSKDVVVVPSSKFGKLSDERKKFK